MVVVCTHADSHFEYAKRALEAGKKCAGRKTVHPDACRAKELFALAKKQRADRHAVSESSL
ncbi:hypothetical protein ACP0HM_20915 [Escherichia coli]